MSYLVLARKYRPAAFDQVIGQEHITQTLAGALSSGRLAHAFCFTGPRGVGKTSVARILAKALNCEQGPSATPCGQCPACREIEEGRAIDVQEIDAASNSGVDDVRELREMIRYRPQSWRYRVTILDEVHMLSRQAFNALLKTLEEPPEHAVFILATTDVHKLPATILSRCQRYDFRRLSPKLLAQHLAWVCGQEGFHIPQESLYLLAHEADGSTRDGLSLLDQILSYGQQQFSHSQVVELLGLIDRTMVADCAKAIIEGNAAKLLDIVEQVYQGGGEMQAFYASLQEQFRNLAAALALPVGQTMLGLTLEEVEQLRQQAANSSPESLHEIFANLAEAEEMFRRASSPRLVMEMTLLKLAQLKPVVDLSQILQMLETSQPRHVEISPQQLKSLLEEESSNLAPIQPPSQASARIMTPSQASGAEALSSQPAPMEQPVDAAKMRDELVSYLARNGHLAFSTCLRQAKAGLQDDGCVVLELNGGALMGQYCAPENQALLNQLANELWDNPRPIKMKHAEKAAPAPSEQTMSLQKACEHPSIKAAMNILQAQPVDIKPLPKQPARVLNDFTETGPLPDDEDENEE